jgi:GT2 family glycosyltransferase
VAVIIVTHNSQRFLPHCLRAIERQTLRPCQIVIVDSGSDSSDYLSTCQQTCSLPLDLYCLESNIGYSCANNFGWQRLSPATEFALFINPDLFLTEDYIADAVALLQEPEYRHCGALTGTLLGYDIVIHSPTGLYDSTGIFQRSWGQWYDRQRGTPFCAQAANQIEPIPAICGAAFLGRQSALHRAALTPGELFDNGFFMYKEDIDLSLRLRQQGWQLLYAPQLHAYHCRGWAQRRHNNPYHLRLLSARNELTLQRRYGSKLQQLYSLAKYGAVRFLHL